MKFTLSVLSTIFLAISASSVPVKRTVNANLVPQFGVKAGVNPTGTGNCEGINGIQIPCSCPPSRQSFIDSLSANVAAGHMVHNPTVKAPFPTDGSQQSAITRMQTAIATLQNLHGVGVGCPAASTTFSAQLAALIAGPTTTKKNPAPTKQHSNPPSPTLKSKPPKGVDPKLVPEFGVKAGVNPSGTGDCDGINGIKIPCSCPPDRNAFIASLSANVAAKHDINNPSVGAPFPTDSSIQSQITRMQTSISTLQNLHGPGVGCPAVSTTWSAQLAALIAKQ